MKLRQTPYVSKKRKNNLLKILTPVLCLATAVLWFTKDKLGIDDSKLFILTGMALLVVSLSYMNRSKEKKLRVEDDHIQKIRDNMGKDNYNSTFFD